MSLSNSTNTTPQPDQTKSAKIIFNKNMNSNSIIQTQFKMFTAEVAEMIITCAAVVLAVPVLYVVGLCIARMLNSRQKSKRRNR